MLQVDLRKIHRGNTFFFFFYENRGNTYGLEMHFLFDSTRGSYVSVGLLN
jgi:hypothetical protein